MEVLDKLILWRMLGRPKKMCYTKKKQIILLHKYQYYLQIKIKVLENPKKYAELEQEKWEKKSMASKKLGEKKLCAPSPKTPSGIWERGHRK